MTYTERNGLKILSGRSYHSTLKLVLKESVSLKELQRFQEGIKTGTCDEVETLTKAYLLLKREKEVSEGGLRYQVPYNPSESVAHRYYEFSQEASRELKQNPSVGFKVYKGHRALTERLSETESELREEVVSALITSSDSPEEKEKYLIEILGLVSLQNGRFLGLIRDSSIEGAVVIDEKKL